MIKLIGIPYDKNSSFLRGPALAPPRIRQMMTDGAANSYSESGLHIEEGTVYEDFGDLNLENLDAAAAFLKIKEACAGLIRKNQRLLSLGGDHSVSHPVMEAHAELYGPLHILQFDAHTDLYTDFDSNYHSHASPFARLIENGHVDSLTQVGVRTCTPGHKEFAKQHGVRIIEMNSIDTDWIKTLAGPLYISLDLDVLDPAFAPGISHHEPGGLSTRQLLTMIQNIHLPIIGADIVEYNPVRDLNEVTAMTAYKCMKELMSVMHFNRPEN